MRPFSFFFFLLLSPLCFSQYLKGKVVDASNQPLAGANVYYEGTTLSCLTNEQGDFSLVFEPKLKRPLVVSYVGYSTVYVEGYTVEEPLLITLPVEVNTLKEVVVKKDKFSRKEKMAVFKEHFLGITPFGLKTVIENEADIDFEYDEKTFILKAYSDNPLIIVNPSLGYKINYELVDFEVEFSVLTIHPQAVYRSYYAGLSRYEEMANSPEVIKHREEAFKGSPLHFFRSLINSAWGKDDFILFKAHDIVNPKDHFTVTNEGNRFKVDIKRQKIGHKNAKTDVVAYFSMLFNKTDRSTVQFNATTIYVDPFGNNLSLRDVTFSGAIQQKRIGDTLPLNYGGK